MFKYYQNMIDENLKNIIRLQNIQLLKYIAFKEKWNYKELCIKYLV